MLILERRNRRETCLVDDNGEPLLCDFGMSRFRHDVSRSNSLPASGGIPWYMAPELVLGGPGDPRTNESTDVYALGILCFRLGCPDHEFFQNFKVLSGCYGQKWISSNSTIKYAVTHPGPDPLLVGRAHENVAL